MQAGTTSVGSEYQRSPTLGLGAGNEQSQQEDAPAARRSPAFSKLFTSTQPPPPLDLGIYNDTQNPEQYPGPT